MKSAEIRKEDVAEAYISMCRRILSEEYLPKIRSCIDQLSDDEIWWRAHETDNSIGNLILHLNGNLRQWIIAGIGGGPDNRDRDAEFNERSHIGKKELMKKFEDTLTEVDRVLQKFDTTKLLEVRHFQKWDHTCMYAIAHVVEHVGQHMGQMIYITKLRKGVDLKLVKL